MKAVTTYIIAMVVILPCFAVFNESDSILPNLCGMMYAVGLYYFSYTKVGKKGLKQLIRANYKLTKIIGF